MTKDLTNSSIERQNILNNRYALQQAEQHLDLGGIVFEGETVFTKAQLVALFEISESTIEKYLVSHSDELKSNGYSVLKGKRLREFKALMDGAVMDYGTKVSVLGIFNFRAVLNLGMLLTESEPARLLRSRLLDIVLDVMAERVGGHTKFINQRDKDYLPAALQQENYRRQFTDALHKRLEACIQDVPETDFERFLDDKRRSLEEQLSDPETLAVLKRLKDR